MSKRIVIGLVAWFVFSAAVIGWGGKKLLNSITSPVSTVSPIIIKPNAVTQKQVDAEYLASYHRIIVDAYNESGAHDRKWDARAVNFLDMFASYAAGASGTPNLSGFQYLGKEALDAGCTDPLVKSCYGMVLASLGMTKDALVMFEEAQPALEKSTYHKIRARANLSQIIQAKSKLGNVPADEMKTLTDKLIALTVDSLSDGSFKPNESRFALTMLTSDFDTSVRDISPLEARAADYVSALQAAYKSNPYVVDVMSGMLETDLAWQARGSGWANTVSEEGWAGFDKHLAKARVHLVRAWKLHPEYPEAPLFMIRVVTGAGGQETPRKWFDRGTAAQFDYIPLYDKFYWAMRPRWVGSHQEMYDFGIQCLKTKRFDTEVPWQFLAALQTIREDDNDGYWQRPETFRYINTMFDGYEAESKGPHGRDLLRSKRAVCYWHMGRYAAARKVINRLGGKFDSDAFSELFGVDAETAMQEINTPGSQKVGR